MPLYDLKNTDTGEVVEHFISISDMEELIASGKWEQVLSVPNHVSQVGDVFSRTPDSFRDLKKAIKKGSGSGNTIEV